eukprot:6213948-Pleurochrysis_carterae.AAC.2
MFIYRPSFRDSRSHWLLRNALQSPRSCSERDVLNCGLGGLNVVWQLSMKLVAGYAYAGTLVSASFSSLCSVLAY